MNAENIPSVHVSTGLPRHYLWPTAEQELVLTAALAPDASAIEAFEQWNASADLQKNIEPGTFRLLPLVYRRMHDLGVAATSMSVLKGVYRHAWCETQTFFHAVAPVFALLQAHNIEMLLLKGAPLLNTYYKGFGLRPMNDIDVVVRRKDIRNAVSLLKKAGWVPQRASDLPERHLDYYQSIDFRNAEGWEIDLHGYFLLDACNASANAWFWASSVPFAFAGVKTRQLDDTASLLHVVVHGMRPNPDPPIRWITDAMTILARTERDIRWCDIIAFARSQRLTHRLKLGFSYLSDKFDAPIPASVLAELQGTDLSLTEWAESKFLFDTEGEPSVARRICLILAGQARRSQGNGLLGFVTDFLGFVRRKLWLRMRLFRSGEPE